MPIRQIDFHATVRPAYRFIDQATGPIVFVEPNGTKFQTILVLEKPGLELKSVSIAGSNASVVKEAWTGELDWPALDEGKSQRKGYLITALLPPDVAPGRWQMQIQAETNSELIGVITDSVTFQKGIAAIPLSFYFGQFPQAPKEASVLLSRPGRPFKVLKVASDTDFVTASFEEAKDGDYRITAKYDGKAPLGRFYGKITVTTDDPAQPTIPIQFEGTVK
jgi:hypothetical protein